VPRKNKKTQQRKTKMMVAFKFTAAAEEKSKERMTHEKKQTAIVAANGQTVRYSTNSKDR
jgi:hypothetical protein